MAIVEGGRTGEVSADRSDPREADMAGGRAQRLMEFRRRCEGRLRDLPLPSPFDIEVFCHAGAERRGRRIVLKSVTGIVARAMDAGIRMPSVALIGYEERDNSYQLSHS